MLVEMRSICKTFADGSSLNDVSLDTDKKGIYGFLSLNDTERTELGKIFAGITRPDSGELYYKEKPMFSSFKQTAIMQKKIGYVPQKCFFDADMTALEVLDLVGKARGVDPDKRFRQIKEALELTGISKKKNAVVETLTLSEKKRLAIAASLIGNPDTVIMDDPLRTLDRTQSAEISDLIRLLGKKKVVILLCSRPDEAEKLCEHIGIINCGKLVMWTDIVSLREASEEETLSLATLLEAFAEIEEEEEE